MSSLRKSLFTLHTERWKDGCGSDQCDRARKVYCRGTLPCEVLLIGEAPGESEDVIGKPFIGPAGKLLDKILERAIPEGVTYALTNLVCCIPRNLEKGGKADEPEHDQIRACASRLQELVDLIAKPKLIVCVGRLSTDYLNSYLKDGVYFKDKTIKMIDVLHPAALLRLPAAHRDLAIRRCIVTISNAIEEMTNASNS